MDNDDSGAAGPALAEARQEGREARRRIAALEAENAILRQALAETRLDAEASGARIGDGSRRERAGRGPNEARCRTRAALPDRGGQARLILDSAADYAIFTTDPDRRVTWWNTGAERLFGWTREEILGRSADLLYPPGDRAVGVPAREAGRALAEGRARNERWHQRKDGSRFWISGMMIPLSDAAAVPGAPPPGFLNIMCDRTAEHEEERALRESEDHLRRTVELNPQIPWTADPAGRVIGFHRRWLDVTGQTRGQAQGRGWMRAAHPKDRARVMAAWKHSLRVGEPLDVEVRLRMADGTDRWWRIRAFPCRDVAGGILRWYGTTEEIDDRKSAEMRLAALVELGDRLRELHSVGGVAGAAAEIAGRTLGAAGAGFGTVDACGQAIRIECGWTAGRAWDGTVERRLAEAWPGLADEIRRGETIAIGDLAADRRTADHAADYLAGGVHGLILAPVAEAGRVVAILQVAAAAPRRWTEEEVAFVHGIAERARAAARRVRAERRRTLLVNELNHRVKNTLAVVQSLAVYTARGTPDPASFAVAFQARLSTLARAHDLLTREDWTGAAVGDVVRAAVAPFAAGAARIDLTDCASGMLLPPGAALSLAMALHELATNAIKYGALSVPEGRVVIACATDPADGGPVIEWIEHGGPPLAGPPARQGFGLRLLGRGLAAQAGMRADIRFEPAGLRGTIHLPPAGPPAEA